MVVLAASAHDNAVGTALLDKVAAETGTAKKALVDRGFKNTAVDHGEQVGIDWRAVCGQCRACKRGRPWYCFATHNASQPMALTDGTPLSPAP